MNQYFGMVTLPMFVPYVPAMTTVPISLHLRKHHCINPENPIEPSGSFHDALDDGLCSTWFPVKLNMCKTSKGVKIDDLWHGRQSAYYKQHRKVEGNSHNKETYMQCWYRHYQEQLDLDTRMRANKQESEDKKAEDNESGKESGEE